MADAQFLAGRLGPQDAATRAQTKAISDGLGAAEEKIGNRNAFARFVPAYLKAAQMGGLNLDPASTDYSLAPERMDRWMPTGDDLIRPAVQPSANRLSLGDIFNNPRAAYKAREVRT